MSDDAAANFTEPDANPYQPPRADAELISDRLFDQGFRRRVEGKATLVVMGLVVGMPQALVAVGGLTGLLAGTAAWGWSVMIVIVTTVTVRATMSRLAVSGYGWLQQQLRATPEIRKARCGPSLFSEIRKPAPRWRRWQSI